MTDLYILLWGVFVTSIVAVAFFVGITLRFFVPAFFRLRRQRIAVRIRERDR